jgi:hypothetical protein
VKETERHSRSPSAITSSKVRERERERERERQVAGRHGVGRGGSDPRLGFGRRHRA